MTELLFGTMTMPSVALGKDNALPNFSILPYTMQDQYGGKIEERKWKTVKLKNEYIEAIFIPQMGGRLWSLRDLTRNRELLYRNPSFVPIDAAIRNAWVPGGVEWNCGSVGHSPFTLSPLFAEAIETDGMPILRMYQYERIHDIIYQISAILPNDSSQLFIHIRVDNAGDKATSMYWSSNIMIERRPGIRLITPGAASKDQRHWVTTIGQDGYGLFETSTDELISRKIKDAKSNSAYYEIRAELSNKEAEYQRLSGNAKLEWTQAFGPMTIDPTRLSNTPKVEWIKLIDDAIEDALPRLRVEAMDKALADFLPCQRGELFQKGGGWGSLEQVLRWSGFHAQGLRFPSSSMSREERGWQDLIFTGALPNRDPMKPPMAYQVSDGWMERLTASIADGKGDHWYSNYMLGIMHAHRNDKAKAAAQFSRSIDLTSNPWAKQCLDQLGGDNR